MQILENETTRLLLDPASFSLAQIDNLLTGETYNLSGDEFEVEGAGFCFSQREAVLEHLSTSSSMLEARFRWQFLQVDVTYSLKPGDNFAEKQISLTSAQPCGVRRIVLSRPSIGVDGIRWIEYRHPSYDLLEAQVRGDLETQGQTSWAVSRPPDSEPCRTFFGRTSKGGLAVGVELSFDASRLQGDRLELAIAPQWKLKAGERLALEAAYFVVYRRCRDDERAAEWGPQRSFFIAHGDLNKAISAERQEHEPAAASPLPSESAAMLALTTAVLGPRRAHELRPVACGWHSEMENWEYTPESAQADVRAMAFLEECGIDWASESHPWGGEVKKLNELKEDSFYEPNPLVRQVLEGAREHGVRVIQWPTMTHSHPWSPDGRPFLAHRKEWMRQPAPEWQDVEGGWTMDVWPDRFQGLRTPCLANAPFWEWVTRLNFQALGSGLYRGWVMDGDFWGTGAYFQTTVPVECYSDEHDHLPGDANYAYQKALEKWAGRVREKYPDFFITMCRPAMDLGVWMQRNVDACFTLVETGTSKSNLAGGNEIRMASRIRVQQQFLPHYLDWPLLFPSYASPNDPPRPWSSENLGYILLSALSCAPNLLMYLPACTGIPPADRAEIHRWLDWARHHIDYLLVRKDLFDWPAPDQVDGSAHLLEHGGLVFIQPQPPPPFGFFRAQN